MYFILFYFFCTAEMITLFNEDVIRSPESLKIHILLIRFGWPITKCCRHSPSVKFSRNTNLNQIWFVASLVTPIPRGDECVLKLVKVLYFFKNIFSIIHLQGIDFMNTEYKVVYHNYDRLTWVLVCLFGVFRPTR